MKRELWKKAVSAIVAATTVVAMLPMPAYAKENIKKLDLTLQSTYEIDGYDLDTIAGIEFKPTKSQLDSMKKQNASYYVAEPEHLRDEKPYNKMSDEEFNSVPFLLGNTKDFQIFFTPNCDNLIVKTPDDTYVKTETYFTITSKGYDPEYSQFDYDGDGEPELMIKIMQCHGLGYSYVNVLGLLIIDKNENGRWMAYHPLFADIMQQFNDNIYAVKESDKTASLYVNGEKVESKLVVDTTEKVDHLELSLDAVMNFIPDGKDIYVAIHPFIFAYDKDSTIPYYSDYDEDCYLKLGYKGKGEFEFGPLSMGKTGAVVFGDEIEKFDSLTLHAYLEGPGVKDPVLLVANEVFPSSNWQKTPKELEGYVYDKDKLVSIGSISVDYVTYGFRSTVGGLLMGDGHKFMKLVPDIDKKCWKVFESASENGEYIDESGKITKDPDKYEEMRNIYYAADILYLR